MYGKPGNFGENSNETVHPGGDFPEKSNTFRGTQVPFRYFVNGVTQNPVPAFGAPKNTVPFDGNFSPKFPYKW